MKISAIGGIAAAALLGIGLAAHQDVRPVPGPGTGIVNVVGAVDVRTLPPVNAAQLGEWKVAVGSAPDVRVAPPPFLKLRASYAVTWSDGVQEMISPEEILPGGWIRTVPVNGRPRWVNLATARSLESR